MNVNIRYTRIIKFYFDDFFAVPILHWFTCMGYSNSSNGVVISTLKQYSQLWQNAGNTVSPGMTQLGGRHSQT